MRIGYKLAAEAFGPNELIRQAVRAEAAGFDFVEISDHYHPWLDVQGHSPFAWTVLGAIAARTSHIELVTGVTCPTVRYHPAIIAQAAATLGIVSNDRFVLGLGAGERLNEHVVGQGFPSVDERHEALEEAVAIIRSLWRGGYHSYRGHHSRLEDARVFDLPDRLPPIVIAAGGVQAARLAGELGDGVFATEPRGDLVEAFRNAGGEGPAYAEIATAWGTSPQAAAETAWQTHRWALTGWKVMAELPNPVNFAAATSTVRVDDILREFACGPDSDVYLTAAQQYLDAGYNQLVLMDAGGDPDGFIDFFSSDLARPMRALSP